MPKEHMIVTYECQNDGRLGITFGPIPTKWEEVRIVEAIVKILAHVNHGRSVDPVIMEALLNRLKYEDKTGLIIPIMSRLNEIRGTKCQGYIRPIDVFNMPEQEK